MTETEVETAATTVTAVDFLIEQQALEAEAALALPDCIDRCSLTRQTQKAYSCLTCSESRTIGVNSASISSASNVNSTSSTKADANTGCTSTLDPPVAVCYACFVQCHTKHSVIELGLRRDFICCCAAYSVCELISSKAVLPTDYSPTAYNNSIDHDVFAGRFCYCKATYDHATEPENSFMLQCVLCENWIHDRCIKNCPDEDEFDEFICKNCVAENQFLGFYNNLSDSFCFVGEEDEDARNSQGRLESSSETEIPATPTKKRNISTPLSSQKRRQTSNILSRDPASPIKYKMPTAIFVENYSSSSYSKQSGCKLPQSILSISAESPIISSPQHLFCFDGWRGDLCHCATCTQYYVEKNLTHLIADDETGVHTTNDADAHKSLLEIGMDALNKIPRVKAIEGVHAYERMASFSKTYFKKFAEEGRIVTKNDIDAMFEELKKIH
ncbi:hypothetical protein HK100_011783 [Physocladia obscura]|uniref:UBR-type domain-containing protein n=1 Tax=Physocladia obscura TaxID=109957 RepID=A0AAD5XDX0_9FUNG|nr:hypothetical protein HK100_011783 [Physocladia obscura]